MNQSSVIENCERGTRKKPGFGSFEQVCPADIIPVGIIDAARKTKTACQTIAILVGTAFPVGAYDAIASRSWLHTSFCASSG